ncbi:MAG: translation initiation factor IF-2 subunit alpha [Candidatus Thermoplasmatota archaeon]|nr:translation initiation factor IF-2 subunit alpha [Candidatus Thermoplasmatota archaeon]
MAEGEEYDWPTEGELVICDVKTVKDFGAFLELEEYQGKEGFVHISEISSGWVKRIQDHIQEGEKRVCKVLRVDKGKGHIDLSLKQVNDHQKREKLQAWKNQKKADNLLDIVAERYGKGLEECYEEFGFELSDKFGSLYKAFEEVSLNSEILKKKGFEGEWTDHFVDVAEENISPPYVSITGFVELSSTNPDGVEDIKESLSAFQDTNDSHVEISYDAAPKYRVEIRSEDYKIAEEIFEEQAEKAVSKIEENGGKGEYYRKE